MKRTPAYSIFLGLLAGSLSGFIVGAASGDAIQGMQLGALTGLFIGWILTNPALQK